MNSDPKTSAARITCIGAAHIDLIARAEEDLVPMSSTPGRIFQSVGGVAANVARQLARRDLVVSLISQTGQDPQGEVVRQTLAEAGVDVSLILQHPDKTTGSYLALEDQRGEMAMAVSDTHALLELAPDQLFETAQNCIDSDYWFVDANLTPAMLKVLTAVEGRPAIAIDAVSVSKAPRLQDRLDEFAIIFCNRPEAEALLDRHFTSTWEAGQAMAALAVAASVITDGSDPVCVQSGLSTELVEVPAVDVVSVTGAGDALIAGTLAALTKGVPLAAAVAQGIEAAAQQLSGTA
jgi:pseudouridine kinase